MTQGMATTAALQISQLFIARSWRALFVVMLVSLHLAAMWGTEDYWARGLMLAHFGLFILMVAIPAETDSAETPQVVDFFYAAMIVLLLIALALGSFAFMTVGKIDYIMALSFSMLIIAGVLLLLSFAWNPRAGFSGLSVYFSRYLLSIGLPFERWLYFLAELSQLETKPERFMKEACVGLARLPWVRGRRARYRIRCRRRTVLAHAPTAPGDYAALAADARQAAKARRE